MTEKGVLLMYYSKDDRVQREGGPRGSMSNWEGMATPQWKAFSTYSFYIIEISHSRCLCFLLRSWWKNWEIFFLFPSCFAFWFFCSKRLGTCSFSAAQSWFSGSPVSCIRLEVIVGAQRNAQHKSLVGRTGKSTRLTKVSTVSCPTGEIHMNSCFATNAVTT